jgi:transcriptional accessory protein Tex/SPT6
VTRFNDGVDDIKDLQEGMVLEGTVSNVAQFGAFVYLGVRQDGLIHVSQSANKFVNDAREVVKTGDIVKVKVLEVDLARKRISLTIKLDAAMPAKGSGARATTAIARQRAMSASVRRVAERLGDSRRSRRRWRRRLRSCRTSAESSRLE